MLPVALVACSSSPVDMPGDAGAATDAADVSTSDTTGDVVEERPYALNGCKETDFMLRTGATDDRTIAWTYTVAPPCMAIARDQSVTWNGNLSEHPLGPQGGNVVTPIVLVSTGTSVGFVFSSPGDYGFVCQNHPFMTGVVRVVP